MPILTRTEFGVLLPGRIATVLAPDDSTFEAAERDAANLGARLSGIAVPADATDAPEAMKRPIAHLIAHSLALTANITDVQMRWVMSAATQARKDLEALRTDRAPSADSEATSADRTGTIADIPTW